MSTTAWRQEFAPTAAVCGVYVLFLALVPPTGEFPSGDDFDYAASAWHLAETGHLRLSDWPAMTLVGHIVWGGLFCAVSGSSFLVLRLSMFGVSALTSLALYAWCRRCGHSRLLAVWFAVTFATSPLTVTSQYTFLTDLSGVALTALLLLLAPRLNMAGGWKCLGYGTLGGLAYLTRETAAIPFLVYCGLVLWQVLRRKVPVTSFICLLIPFTLMVGGHYLWLQMLHGVPSNRTVSMIAVGSPVHHLQRLYRIAAMLALRLLPVSVLLLARRDCFHDRKAWSVATALVTAVVALTWLSAGGLPQPLGDDLFDLGMRFPELPVDAPPADMRGPQIPWSGQSLSLLGLLTSIAAPASLIVLCQLLIAQRKILATAGFVLRQRTSLAALTFLATLILMVLLRSYLARYTLTLLLPAMMGIAGLLAADTSPRRMTAAWLTTGLIGLLSLIGIQDGMERSRAFYTAIDEVHRRGVEPSYVDAGLAYAGFYRFNPMYRGADNIGPFITNLPSEIDPETYEMAMAAINPATVASDLPIQVSFRTEPGYDVLDTVTYRSWFRSGEVYVLFRRSYDLRQLPAGIQQWHSEQE